MPVTSQLSLLTGSKNPGWLFPNYISLTLIYFVVLTRGGGQLRLSSLVVVLHCGSGPYSAFMAKTVGVKTPLFVCNAQLYFPPCFWALSVA
jgi:hypothetical protein